MLIRKMINIRAGFIELRENFLPVLTQKGETGDFQTALRIVFNMFFIFHQTLMGVIEFIQLLIAIRKRDQEFILKTFRRCHIDALLFYISNPFSPFLLRQK